MERVKLKITVDLPKYVEPRKFVCSICGETHPEWMEQHRGKYKVCIKHERPRGDAHNKNFGSYYDALQVDAARMVIKEIENAARN